MATVTVAIPDDLLERIDAEAARQGIARSTFLALAVRRELVRRDPDAITAAIARSVERFREVGDIAGLDAAALDAAALRLQR